MAMCQDRFPEDGNSADPAWWACLNTVIAIAIQLKAINSAFRKVSEFSWGFFKNAFSVFEELASTDPSILAIQATLAMATFMSGTTDLRTTVLLTSTAIRMIQIIGLHRENADDKLSALEAEQRRRIFWIAYLLDTSSSINSGLPPALAEDFEVSLPSEDSPDGLGNLNVSKAIGIVNIFRLRIQLVIIESKVHKRLFGMDGARIAGQYVQNQVPEFYYELKDWKEKVPIEIQPNYNPQAVVGINNLPVLMLHFAFYNCVGMIHRAAELHGYQKTRNNTTLEQAAASASDYRLVSSSELCAEAARATLRLLRYMESVPFVDLW
jgi:hypothetical protein